MRASEGGLLQCEGFARVFGYEREVFDFRRLRQGTDSSDVRAAQGSAEGVQANSAAKSEGP